MIILDYDNGRHPDSGKLIHCYNDIIITPFWTDEFCKTLIDISKFYNEQFSNNIEFDRYSEKSLGWFDIRLDYLSPYFFEKYVNHYKRDIIPLLEKVFSNVSSEIDGWFSPYIIKYDEINQKSDLHSDISQITLNIKLNNDYEGCDLYFPRQDFNSKDIPMGYAMIWPSTVTHPHGSTPLIRGEKYSFVSWTWPPTWSENGIKNI